MDAVDRKRKWDEPAGDGTNDNRANDAAAAAAAIAAKIAASLRPGAAGNELVKREGFDEGFVKDIEINDLRNRYVLTKGSTQKQVSATLGRGSDLGHDLTDHRRLGKRSAPPSRPKVFGFQIEQNSNRVKHHYIFILWRRLKASLMLPLRRSTISSTRNLGL